MTETYNKYGISLTEGHVFLDGVEIMDCVKCEIKVTPDVWSGKVLGERTPSSRWKGMSISGSITRRRSTPWIKDLIKKYLSNGVTPEFTIQGVISDQNSDYYKKYGTDTVTAVGCVLTGDIILTSLDSGGDMLEDVLSFNAKDIIA